MAVATAPVAPAVPDAEEIVRKIHLVDELLCELRDQGLPRRRLTVRFPGLDERFDPRELRLSEVGGCPRLRAARRAGIVPPDEVGSWDAGYFLRGRLAELVVRAAFLRRYARRFRSERAVTHPWGFGHADLWLPAERLLVEIKSASTDSGDSVPEGLPRPEHVAQAQAYLHFLRDGRGRRRADLAILVYVMAGQRLTWRIYPVCYRPEQGERIEAELGEIDRRAAQGAALQIPVPAEYSRSQVPCVRYLPSGQAVRCPLHATCWGVADPDEDGAVEAEGEALEAVLGYAGAHRASKAAEAGLKGERQRLLQAFAGLGDPKRLRGGPVVVTRSEVAGRVDYDTEAAIACGALPREALEPFARQRAGSVQFRLSVKGEEAGK